MKIKLISFLLVIATATIAVLYDHIMTPDVITEGSQEKSVIIAKPLPVIEATLMDGKQLTLNNLKEPILLINFWATWCAPCLVEMPQMVQLANESQGKVALVTISIDDKEKSIQKYLSKLEKQYPNLNLNQNTYWIWDEDKSLSLQTFNVSRVPETIVVDQNRTMVKKLIGEHDWSTQNMKNDLFKLYN